MELGSPLVIPAWRCPGDTRDSPAEVTSAEHGWEEPAPCRGSSGLGLGWEEGAAELEEQLVAPFLVLASSA